MTRTIAPQSTEFPELLSPEEVDGRVPTNEVHYQRQLRQPTDKELADSAAGLLRLRFPRIHQQLGTTWGTAACERFLDRLIVDDRGDRAGFPPDVMHALLILQRVHFRQFGTFAEVDPWDIGLTK